MASAVPPTPLAAAIRELRVQYGSHDRLARRLGTTRNTVIRWEKGATPNDESQARLIEAGLDPSLFESPVDPVAFSTSLLGANVELLEREPELLRMNPGLLRALANELRRLAGRLEAAAANGLSDEQPPG